MLPMFGVHLLHTYLNTPELPTDLKSVTWTVRRGDLQDEPTLRDRRRDDDQETESAQQGMG